MQPAMRTQALIVLLASAADFSASASSRHLRSLPLAVEDVAVEHAVKIWKHLEDLESTSRLESTVSGSTVALSGGLSRDASGEGHECSIVDSGFSIPNAQPANYADSRKTRYDKAKKMEVPVTFAPGATIDFKCEKGYSTNGAKEDDANKQFQVTCKEAGYLAPCAGCVCVKASKCGELPKIENARPTGSKETKENEVQFECIEGFSLDGETVVQGSARTNQLFNVECDAFAGTYKDFKGTCKAYDFVNAQETTRIYNKVGEVLFIVSCKGVLKKEMANVNGKGLPSKIEDICSNKLENDAECTAAVAAIKAEFDTRQVAWQKHMEDENTDWHEKLKDAPKLDDSQATGFCTALWSAISNSK